MSNRAGETIQCVDFRSAPSVRSILPCAPLLSSPSASSAALQFNYYHQPVWETPAAALMQHAVMIYTGQPVQTRRRLESGWQTNHYQIGQLGIYPAQAPQQVGWNAPVEFVHLYIMPATLDRVAVELFQQSRYELLAKSAIVDPLMTTMAMQLRSEIEGQGLDRLYLETVTMMLALHLLKHHSNVTKSVKQSSGRFSTSQLQVIQDYILAHLDRNIALQELADLTGLNPHYFCRLFKTSLGITPHQYLLKCRVERAAQLLQHTDYSIADIAHKVGFYDQSRLTQVFRRWMGVTPKNYQSGL
jgi:AraC family transcriptional regulator